MSQQEGSRRMRELGYKPVQVWLTAAEHDFLSRAAERGGCSLALLCKLGAMHKAACTMLDAPPLANEEMPLAPKQPAQARTR